MNLSKIKSYLWNYIKKAALFSFFVHLGLASILYLYYFLYETSGYQLDLYGNVLVVVLTVLGALVLSVKF